MGARIKSLEEPFVESVRVLRLEQNALAPISSLPPEILAIIFSFLCWQSLGRDSGHNLAQIRLSHVCRHWCEIALNQSLLWSHVDFTTLTWTGAAEKLARAKSAPLYFEAEFPIRRWNGFPFDTFRKELQARIPHILCYLGIRADCAHLHSTLSTLKQPAPTLDFTTKRYYQEEVFIPDTLFDGSAPRLSSLKLCNCGISWKLPLWPFFKGLKYLQVFRPVENSRPKLADWLGALAEMPILKTLTLQPAERASPEVPPFPFDIKHIVSLPSLTQFQIEASLEDCVLALGHLDLPALTWLSLEVYSDSFPTYSDVQELLPHVARFAYRTQHTRPLQSVLIRNDQEYVDMLAWPAPDIGVEVNDPPILLGETLFHLALSFRSSVFEAYSSASGYYSHLDLLD